MNIFRKNYHLHSTMYLLNQYDAVRQAIADAHLHSTMYLLNQIDTSEIDTSESIYIPLCIY